MLPLIDRQIGAWNMGDAVKWIAFYTFKGYSSGFVYLTVTPDEECVGHNLILSDSQPPIYSDDTRKRSTQASSLYCTDVWFINAIEKLKPLPLGNFTFTLDHTQLTFPVADQFTMVTSSSVIFQSSFFVFDENNISVEVSMLNMLNTLSPENYTFTVPLFTQNEYALNTSEQTVFKITYTGCDEYPLLAIRVHFSEHRICSPSSFLLPESEMVVHLIEYIH